MRRLALSACLATALVTTPGCKSGSAMEVPPDQRLAASDALNGKALAVSSSGPWQLRGASGQLSEFATPTAAAPRPAPTGARGGDEDKAKTSREDLSRPAMRKALAADTIASGGAAAGIGSAAGGPPPPPAAAPPPMAKADMPSKPAAPEGLADMKGGGGGLAMAKEEAGVERKAMPSMRPTEAPRPAFQALRAGSTDDNADYGEFVKFLASWSDRRETAGKADLLDVRDRRLIRVVDDQGRRVPTAQVVVVDQTKDKVLWSGLTYGDGQLPFYPRVVAGGGKYTVEAVADGKRGRATWDGTADVIVPLAGARSLGQTIQLDVLFAIDTTGSMQDEIDRIKGSLLNVTDRLKALKQEFDLRYGAVLYRDLGDDYLTSTYPFTSDIQAFASALQQVNASGGGDLPESVNQALAEAVRAPWRPGAAKIVFLVGDAAPHMDYQGDIPYGQSIKAAVAKGVRIHSVAASGLDPLGTLVWRQVAQFTRGKFIFIEYGSPEASAAAHGVTGDVKSNNLDDIIFEQIKDELAYWGKDGPAQNVADQQPVPPQPQQ